MKITFEKHDKIIVGILLIVICLIVVGYIINQTIRVTGTPSNLNKEPINSSFDDCNEKGLSDCSLIQNRGFGVIIKPKSCCMVINNSHQIWDIYYWRIVGSDMKQMYRDLDRARKCKKECSDVWYMEV